ncbi:MAG TPA: hypothetical protein VNF75_03530 [Candidatus Dormibacteraeota bacterium]|nr:hypothetical protein [Candidatus Dormibacteraeota bacterium]
MAKSPQAEVVREHLALHRTRQQELHRAVVQEAERIARERESEPAPGRSA